MTVTDWEIVVAIIGIAIGTLSTLQQSHAPRPALRSLSLTCIIVSGLFTVRALSLKRSQVAEERRRAAELELRLERAGGKVEHLGNRLHAALAENSRLLASMEAMRHDLTAIREATHGAPLPPQYVSEQSLDGTWNGNVIRVRIRAIRTSVSDHKERIIDWARVSDSFAPGPLRGRPRTANVALLNVRPADMNTATFKLLAGDLTSRLTLVESWRGRKPLVATPAFAHGDTIIIAPAQESLAEYWISGEFPPVFVERNPDAALQITLH